MATPHIQAQNGEVAKTVLMPGDPLRAKYFAETFLEDVVQFNSVRNMFGYTGTYKGKRVSIMGSGMGIPSIGIYAHELYKFYDVDNIIRIGSAGSYKEDLNIYDTILVTGAFSESNFALRKANDPEKIQLPSEHLNENIRKAAAELGVNLYEGIVWSSDIFYYEDNVLDKVNQIVVDNNIIAAEMESFGLFATAKVLKKNAACLLTVSDSIVKHVETTHEERRTNLVNMVKVALEAVE